MKIVTSQEMTSIDRRAQEDFGIPGLLLMENAGQKAFATWRRLWHDRSERTDHPGRTRCTEHVDHPERTRRTEPLHHPEHPDGAAASTADAKLVFVAGKGNNGGDALVMARQAYIERLQGVVAVPVAAELKGNVQLHLDVLRRLGVPIVPWDTHRAEAVAALENAEVIFDGIAGTGIRGGLREPLSDIVKEVNAAQAPVVAVDVPSGLADDYCSENPLVQAHMTLTMGLPKRCLYLPKARAACGTIYRIALGFPPVLTSADELSGDLLAEGDIRRLIPPITDTTYKHRRGVLAVYAGARGTSGAASLAAGAAARSRAGMVRVFADEGVYPVLASQLRSVMVAEWSEDLPDLEGHDAVLVGPGWGTGGDRSRALSAIIDSGLPGVLDADGINLLAEMKNAGKSSDPKELPDLGGKWVLTPHAGECARLVGASAATVLERPFEMSLEVAQQLDAVIVLKSHVTIVAGPDGRYSVLDGMNPAMGTGGVGDVLAGIIAAFLAGGADAYSAAAAGVVLHDAVGKRCFAENGWFVAEDLLEMLSRESARLLP